MSPPAGRLRIRLAVLGVVGVVTPLLVLLAVSAWTNEEVRTSSDGTTVTETGQLSPWIPATVVLLVVPTAVGAWWWAGREVALHVQAARAVEDQRRLIEDTSHRLRTPIAIMLANVDVTLAEPDLSDDELREALRASRDAAASMQHVVEDLLANARTRHHDDGRSTVDLVALTAGVCRAHVDRAAGRGVSIRRTGPGHLPAEIDGRALERAIDPIVDNAVRHAPPHTEVVVAVAVAGDEQAAMIHITDQGPGIPPGHQPRLFERYWTTDPARTGIGLAVAAAAAGDGFTIEVVSPLGPDGGTRFTITVPRPPTSGTARAG